MEEAFNISIGGAIFVGLVWFFVSCTNDKFGPNVKIEEQQSYDLKYTRCKELCSGSVKVFNLRTCECK